MLRLNRLPFLLLACCVYFSGIAQTPNCTADFSYTVSVDNTVNFIARDTVATRHRWSFGDGTPVFISENGIASHHYAQSGKYEVKQFIENPAANCKDSVVKVITLPASDSTGVCILSVNFHYRKDSIDCKKIYFSNTYSSTTGNVHFTWSFGDGSTSHDAQPVHAYAQPGKYYVCLVAETGTNCRKEYCDSVIANCETACNIAIKYEYAKDSLDCKKIHFISHISSPVLNIQYSWNFGDGTDSHDINPVHVYAQAGKYRVCLVTEAGTNCRKEYCDSVIANCETACAIAIKYEYTKDSLDCKKIRFISHVTPPVSNIQYVWNFGDGTSSHDINPVHVYAQSGKYYVCLVIESGNNCRRQYCDSVRVNCETECNTYVKYQHSNDTSDCKKIHFINQSIAASSATHFVWNFGDGTLSHDINPVHVYEHPGRYLVCLVAETGSNCRKEYCDSLTVNCAVVCSTIARFETRHDTKQWNLIYFGNVTKPAGNVWQTYWSYGDGTSSRDYNSFHEYTSPGLYQVCLKVIGLDKCISSYCDTVRIIKPINCDTKALFYHDSSKNLIAVFEALYKYNNAVYFWDFGDGSASLGKYVSHVYAKPGHYKVCLTVKTDGCSVTHCEEIVVNGENGSGRIMLFPNPAVNTVSLEVTLSTAGPVLIRLMDSNGGVKAVYNKSGLAGSNRFSLPVENLSQGIYLVEIKTNKNVSFSRFVKG